MQAPFLADLEAADDVVNIGFADERQRRHSASDRSARRLLSGMSAAAARLTH
jgi:hypothetical protein